MHDALASQRLNAHVARCQRTDAILPLWKPVFPDLRHFPSALLFFLLHPAWNSHRSPRSTSSSGSRPRDIIISVLPPNAAASLFGRFWSSDPRKPYEKRSHAGLRKFSVRSICFATRVRFSSTTNLSDTSKTGGCTRCEERTIKATDVPRSYNDRGRPAYPSYKSLRNLDFLFYYVDSLFREEIFFRFLF